MVISKRLLALEWKPAFPVEQVHNYNISQLSALQFVGFLAFELVR